MVYYGNAGSGDPTGTLDTGYIAGDYTGTASIRYDPHQGLIAKVSGSNEVLFTASVDSNRLITSMTIESLRNENHAEHDERIDNIMVSYAFSEYSVFDESCSAMDGFQKDMTLSTSDGSIVAIPGLSYLALTSIADGSGWHGPAYVKPLDRPFRLYQLSEFTADGELLQGTAAAEGKMSVALYDEDMQPFLEFEWSDIGSNVVGAFTTRVYREVSSTVVYTTGPTLFTSFEKSGTFWFDQGQVHISIDGSGTGTPVTPDNAARILKYIVIKAAAYGTDPLVGLRAHDIHIEVGVNAVAPGGGGSNPVECDGTTDGSMSESVSNEADQDITNAQAQLISYVEFEPWPYLHWVREETNNDGTSFHVKRDLLLGETTVVSGSMLSLTAMETQSLFLELGSWIFEGLFAELVTKVAVLWEAVEVASAAGPVALPLLAKACLSTIALVVLPIVVFQAAYEYGLQDKGWLAAKYLIAGLICLGTAWGYLGALGLIGDLFNAWYLGLVVPLLTLAALICKFGLLSALMITIVGVVFIAIGLAIWFGP